MFKLFALVFASIAVANPVTTREVTWTNPAITRTVALPAPGATTTATPPPQFNITSVDMNGTGCPPGSGKVFLNAAHTAVTVTFSQYDVSAGPGIPITENRKNCQVTLKTHVPSGFTFAIIDVDYRGYYQLDTGVKGSHSAIYYFQGQTVQGESGTTINGPIDGANFVYRDEFNLSPTVYAPCGQDSILNLNSEVRVDNTGNTNGFGYFVDDSVDASINQTYNFAWLTCP
ncbi:secreted protein [Flagelloscypha sp. PMI_526]|nr:secreted protein [Flagelloscypha sp. PMI_526]